MTLAKIIRIPKSTAMTFLNEYPLARISLIPLIIAFSSCRFERELVGNVLAVGECLRRKKGLRVFYFPKLRTTRTMSRMSIRVSLLTSARALYRGDPGEELKAATTAVTSFISTVPS